MIDEARTLELFGYTSDELGKWSKKPIAVVCEKCGEPRTCRNDSYRDLCMSCVQIGNTSKKGVIVSDEGRRNMSRAGALRPPMSDHTKELVTTALIGRPVSEETRRKISESENGKYISEQTRRKSAESHTGLKQSEDTCRRRSATHQGLDYDRGEWNGFTDKSRPHLLPIHACAKINKWFPGCDGHHLSRSLVAFVPSELHNHIWHNIKTGSGMAAMNAIALQFAL